ncbi:phage holin family protein [Candidatus Uhrbacteria bacterium]|nr:phage holin family protein [Candidatus Uhrbacteria bacterium]
MPILINWLVSALAIFAAAYLLPQVSVDSFWTALVLAVVLGLINAILKPILLILTLPVNILTLGLFTFVINGLLIMLASGLTPGFSVGSFWWAMLFSLVLSLINGFLKTLAEPDREDRR